jgi:iron complex outermembrane receptor protein
MKKLYTILSVFFWVSLYTYAESSKTSLSGVITDKGTGDTLAGVTVYFPDLKAGTVTDQNGYYKIDNLPAKKVLVQVSMLGYRNIIETVDLSAENVKNFSLIYTATEINEVVVTGLSTSTEQKRTPSPISVVPKTELLQNASANIIDAIASQPGVSEITTGVGISKPVIRGLGYNRVVVINDDIRQEGQQWGDEHGIEIDQYAIGRVEILKGPASLVYGSDAMAGVINLISYPSLPEGTVKGNALVNWQSNDGLFGFSGEFAGNHKGFVWNIRYSRKVAHAYQNKYDGYVYNSGLRENAASIMTGINRSWGYSHFIVSTYYLMPGIVEGERDSTTGKFIKPFIINDSIEGDEIVPEHDFLSYMPQIPYQKIHHYKAVLNNDFILGSGDLKVTLGFQQNHRQEFAEIAAPDQYGLYFLLNTVNYNILYNFPEVRNFDVSLGVNGMWQSSENKGEEFLVPEYTLFDAGLFSIVRKKLGEVDISGGIRFDSRQENGQGLYLSSEGERIAQLASGAIERFKAFNSVFSGFSGSIGATWQITGLVYTKLNMSMGFRAPNIAELGSNGVHEGTARYEIGDPDLKPENSMQLDYAFGLNTEHISAEADVFYNAVDNYIFLHKLSSVNGGDSIREGVNTFKFFSGDARLFGGELRFEIHPHPYDWLNLENTFSYVNAIQKNQPDSMKYLPLTPAPKDQITIRTDIKKAGNIIRNAYIRFDAEFFFRQDHIYSAFGTETKTPGYTLLNAGIGTDIGRSGKTLCSVYFSLNNITDVAYQNHLSRLKYTGTNYATRREGVFDMGRNFSVKLVIPVGKSD